jgi:hypothetical protein
MDGGIGCIFRQHSYKPKVKILLQVPTVKTGQESKEFYPDDDG